MSRNEREEAARRYYENLPALEVQFDVGIPNNLIDRAMCVHYAVGEPCNADEPYRSGSLHNARTWRQRPFSYGGCPGVVYKNGEAALKDVGEAALLYDVFARLVNGY